MQFFIYSNTTLVKVKYPTQTALMQQRENSNTTLVKVKFYFEEPKEKSVIEFKYNTC